MITGALTETSLATAAMLGKPAFSGDRLVVTSAGGAYEAARACPQRKPGK